MPPLVSVCTPTFNRRPFIPSMFQCFLSQDYPKDCMEWIIVDDGTDPIEDLVRASGIPQIKYVRLTEKLPLGKKRNLMHSHTKGEILVYMDDDDYYPPQRVSHAVERLTNSPALCAGSSILFIYYKLLHQIYKFGPYGANHATAGTFAFKRELLKDSAYDDAAALAEEKSFLKNYTVPFVQLDPMKVILVFAHPHNTFDKHKLLGPKVKTVRELTNLNVKDFISDKQLYHFYTRDMYRALYEYPEGDTCMKPDVLAQMSKTQLPSIRFGDKILTGDEIVAHLNHQQDFIKRLTDRLRANS